MKRGRLRPVSAKRLAEKDRRNDVREITLRRAMFRCQARGVFGLDCSGPLHVHELQARGVRPGGHLDPDNTIALCRAHHDYVTNHPSEAEAAGLRFRSWQSLPSTTGPTGSAGLTAGTTLAQTPREPTEGHHRKQGLSQ